MWVCRIDAVGVIPGDTTRVGDDTNPGMCDGQSTTISNHLIFIRFLIAVRGEILTFRHYIHETNHFATDPS